MLPSAKAERHGHAVCSCHAIARRLEGFDDGAATFRFGHLIAATGRPRAIDWTSDRWEEDAI
jgi:hypothetical protein